MGTNGQARQPEMGLVVKPGETLVRVLLRCPHQHGQAYMVRGERSWVCSDELLHAHVLAGFLRELVRLESPQVRELMQRWGLYYRELPLEEGAATPEAGGAGSKGSA